MPDIIVKDGSLEDERYTKIARDIAGFALNKLNLSFGNVEFRLVDNDTMAEQMALYSDPLPTWYTGQEYVMSRRSLLGVHSSLYEMVGHTQYKALNDKVYTVVYLNKNDEEHEIRGVIAHVYGHLHANANNFICKQYSQDLGQHAAYRRRYRALEELVGRKEVERVFDLGQTLSSLVDLYPDFRVKKEDKYYSKDEKLPDKDEYDVFGFLMKTTPMREWERETLEMVRDIYAPIREVRVHIMHEGFATFVQEKYALEAAKTDPVMSMKMEKLIYDIATPLSEGQLPYAMGFRLFKDIENRWNKGKHGIEFELLPEEEKKNFDSHENKGLEKILEVMKFGTDWDFLFSFADETFINSYVKEAVEEAEGYMRREMAGEYTPDQIEGILPSQLEMYRESMDPDELRFELLHQTESYMPTLYIPRGGANYKDGVLIKEDLSVLERYVTETDREKRKEELEEIKSGFAPFLTLNNETTYKAVNRISKWINKPVYLKTIDEDGSDITIFSNGEDVDFEYDDDDDSH